MLEKILIPKSFIIELLGGPQFPLKAQQEYA